MLSPGIAGAEALGQRGTNGVAEMSGGGGGNLALMMISMALGGAIGQNLAGMMRDINVQTSGTQSFQGMKPSPIPQTDNYVVLNGQAAGPYAMEGLAQMFIAGTLAREVLCGSRACQNG